jgi:hypothetical protein
LKQLGWRRGGQILLGGAYAFGVFRFIRALPTVDFDFLHTIFAIATLGIVLLILAEAVARLATRQAGYRSQFRLAIITVLLMLVGTEAWLRFGWGLYVNGEEKNLGHYRTRFLRIDQMKGNDPRQQRYFLHPPHWDRTVTFPEFTYRLRTNALGLRGPEIDARPAPGVFRIISIGDSFTEGFGVNESETWPLQLEQLVASRAPGQRVESINAGVAGSDPVFESTMLEEVLAPMRPDLVLLAVSANDLWDLCDRGGFERYRPDGSIVLKPGPSWEWVYAVSYIVRHVMHDVMGYDRLLRRTQARRTCEDSGREVLRTAVDRSSRLAEAVGFSLVVVIHPMVFEIETGTHALDNLWEGNPPAHANVLWLRHWFARQGIRPDNVDEFYYPLDRHHTARGLRIFAEGVMDHIVKTGLFPATGSAS